MSASGDTAKARQRRAARRQRAAMVLDYRRVADAAIAHRLREVVAGAAVVAAYAALEEEVRLDALLVAWLEEGKEVLLPRVDGPGSIVLHRVSDLDQDLEPGLFGVREPLASCPVGDPGSVNAVLVPGVAFDRAGGRIGYGGGFYDRLLPGLPAAVSVGVCYEAQLVDRVAREPHDVSVDAVVTEGDVYR